MSLTKKKRHSDDSIEFVIQKAIEENEQSKKRVDDGLDRLVRKMRDSDPPETDGKDR